MTVGSRPDFKYFEDPDSLNNWSELLKMLMDAANLDKFLAECPKAKEAFDKSPNYAEVLWKYRASSWLMIPFPEDVEVKQVGED